MSTWTGQQRSYSLEGGMTVSVCPSGNACALIAELHSHTCLCNETSTHHDVMHLIEILTPYSQSPVNI